MLTGQGTIETAVEAMKLGAYDYLTKPYSINELDVRVRQAAEKRNLRVDNQRLRAQIERKSATPEIISQSEAMAEAIRLVQARGAVRGVGTDSPASQAPAKN
jgi:DNA-binding NtrC family response regulator